MSTLLLKINFNDKNELSEDTFKKICKDLTVIINNKKIFNNKEKIFINYLIKKKKK